MALWLNLFKNDSFIDVGLVLVNITTMSLGLLTDPILN